MLERASMAFQNPPPERDSPSKADGGIQSLVQAEKLLQIAFILPSSMIIGWLAGAWLDNKWHQSWITIAGVIFGCTSGLVYVVRLAMAAGRNADTSGTADKSTNGSSDRKQ
jgi:ATP synthase protein I